MRPLRSKVELFLSPKETLDFLFVNVKLHYLQNINNLYFHDTFVGAIVAWIRYTPLDMFFLLSTKI